MLDPLEVVMQSQSIGNLLRILLLPPLLAPVVPALAADEDAGFGHMLPLMQVFVRLAGQSGDPVAGLKAMDDVLAGRNAQANEAAAGLFKGKNADMRVEHRTKNAS